MVSKASLIFLFLIFSKLAISYSDHFLSQEGTDGEPPSQLKEAALSAALKSVDLPVSNNQGSCHSYMYVQCQLCLRLLTFKFKLAIFVVLINWRVNCSC